MLYAELPRLCGALVVVRGFARLSGCCRPIAGCAVMLLLASVLVWSAQAVAQPAPYLGCFKDQGEPGGTRGRDLDGFVRSDRGMTGAMCVAECAARGFAYAGTQFSSFCFCGNSYGRSGAANNCDMACSGNAQERCGGAWANSVYATQRATPPIGGGVEGVPYPSPRIAGMQVDWCPTFGANCGQAGADLFCRSQGSPRAVRWQWAYTDVTWVIGSGQVCQGGRCGALRDVVCAPLR